jgi:endogenous inhibitor of DNA gyrase (YacG/DUF329 family)
MTKNPLSNQLEQRFQRSYSSQSYIERYTSVYLLFQLLQVAISIFLAVCSFKFWEALFMSKAGAGLTPTLLAGAATVLVSFIIYLLLNVMLKSYFSGDRIHWLIPALVGIFIAGDIYANVHGIPELTSSMIPVPVDTKTPETDQVFASQLKVIDQELARVKHRYYWCSHHKTNHAQHGKCQHEKFWISKKSSDYRRIEQLGKQRTDLVAQHTAQRNMTLNEHQADVSDRIGKLSRRTNQLKYLQAFMYCLLFIVVYWCHHFGSASIQDDKPRSGPGPIRGQPEPDDDDDEDVWDNEVIKTIPISPDGTRRVYNDSRRVKVEGTGGKGDVHIHGQGFSYVCTQCDKEYLAKRPLLDDQRPFCCDKCRTAWWKEERKRRREEEKNAA